MPYLDFGNTAIATSRSAIRLLSATTSNRTVNGTVADESLRDSADGSVLAGGGGDDTYVVTSPATSVVEAASGGIDTVNTIRSFTLGANVENLTLLAANITGIGNDLANLIVTSAGGTTIVGGAGNDVLVDAAANVATHFVFARGSGSDSVYGFDTTSGAHDVVRLVDFGFTSFADVRSHLSQQGSDVLLTLGGTDRVIFRDTKVGDFTADNFELQLDLGGYTKTFSDEFSTGISLYNLATGDGVWKTNGFYSMQTGPWATGSRTLNDEQQIYVDPNYEGTGPRALGLNPFSVSDGILSITASRTPDDLKSVLAGKSFVSGEITTERSFSQLYGYFEIRAQLPGDKGMWPAFWLLPAAGGQPPEIDIFEQIGTDDIFQSIHTTDPTRASATTVTTYLASNDTAFHTYGMKWTATTLTWYVDGVATATMATPSDMHQPMYLLANLAVGGSWAGDPDAALQSSNYKIDYIRAYALPDTPGVVRTGTAASDVLVGTAGNDTIDGGRGNDTIDGAGGADRLVGGAGDDSYVVYSARDVVVENPGEGIDLVRSWADVRLSDNVENATLLGLGDIDAFGNALNNVLTGNWGRNTLSGGDGNDVLDATGGRTWNAGAQGDILIGGRGDDLFITDDTADVLVELAGQGTDTVRAGYNYVLGDNFENLELTGWARNGTGNAADNVLTGNADDNSLWGMDGNDILYGREGNDHLDGSGGRDILYGGPGNDVFIISEGDTVVEYAGEGIDIAKSWVSFTLSDNVENLLLFEGGDLDATGNALANVLTGNSRDNRIDGKAGDDVIDGRGGNDILTGGAGADVFKIDIGGAIVITDFGANGDHDSIELSSRLLASGPVTVRSGVGGTILSVADVSVLLAGVSSDSLVRTDTGFASVSHPTSVNRAVTTPAVTTIETAAPAPVTEIETVAPSSTPATGVTAGPQPIATAPAPVSPVVTETSPLPAPTSLPDLPVYQLPTPRIPVTLAVFDMMGNITYLAGHVNYVAIAATDMPVGISTVL